MIKDYRALSDAAQHSRYPVVNKNTRVVGIVTAKDVLGKADTQLIERVMTKDPRRVKKRNECSFSQSPDDLGWFGGYACCRR